MILGSGFNQTHIARGGSVLITNPNPNGISARRSPPNRKPASVDWGLGYRVGSAGRGVYGSGFRVQDSGSRV